MTLVSVLLLALLIGVVAGLRAMTPPAAAAWGAMLGWIDVTDKWSEWMAHPITVTVLTIFLIVELVTDQLPSTPSRKVAPQFIARLVSGGFAGAVIGSVIAPTSVEFQPLAANSLLLTRSPAIRLMIGG